MPNRIGQDFDDDVPDVLFVRLVGGVALNEDTIHVQATSLPCAKSTPYG